MVEINGRWRGDGRREKKRVKGREREPGRGRKRDCGIERARELEREIERERERVIYKTFLQPLVQRCTKDYIYNLWVYILVVMTLFPYREGQQLNIVLNKEVLK